MRFPTSNPDFAPFVQRIKDAKPDVAFILVPAGTQATAMIKAVRDLGLREAGINVISTQDLLPDEQLPQYGRRRARPDHLRHLLGCRRSSGEQGLPRRPGTANMPARRSPDFLSVDGWDGMAAIFDLIKATKGKFTGDEAIKFLSNWKTADSPRGPISIDPATRDIVQNIYMRKIEMKDGKLANIEIRRSRTVKDPWKELNPPK